MPAISSRPGALAARLIWPPSRSVASSSTTSWPRRRATRAASIPPTPPPTTTTLRFAPSVAGTACGMVASRPVAALWMQSASLPW